MNQSKDFDWITKGSDISDITMLEEQRHTKLMDEFSKTRRIELLEGRARNLEAQTNQLAARITRESARLEERLEELERMVKAINGAKVGPVIPSLTDHI
jgi:uncharacterized protein YccT (UPF0319 family)